MENVYKWYCFLTKYNGYSEITGLNKFIAILSYCQQTKELVNWSLLISNKLFSVYFSFSPFPDYQSKLFHTHILVSENCLQLSGNESGNGMGKSRGKGVRMVWFYFAFTCSQNWYNKCFFSFHLLQVDCFSFTYRWAES